MSQSLSSRAMSFDDIRQIKKMAECTSQSLSSRAMSFDKVQKAKTLQLRGLNPFRAGRCLSTPLSLLWEKQGKSQSLSSRAMSFDNISFTAKKSEYQVSIPFEQGDVFRL